MNKFVNRSVFRNIFEDLLLKAEKEIKSSIRYCKENLLNGTVI